MDPTILGSLLLDSPERRVYRIILGENPKDIQKGADLLGIGRRVQEYGPAPKILIQERR